MAGKKPIPKANAGKTPVKSVPLEPVKSLFFLDFNMKLVALAAITLIFYINTINNQHALDDGIVIENNSYVLNGFGGIGKIMTTDAYDSYYKKMNAGQQLSGGRYRPLSEVIFAIEHEFFGEPKPGEPDTGRHFFSILAYVFCVLVVFYFLAKFLFGKLRYGEDMAFLATLLFAIHPIHTEVVANVKSLDEILSMLFICLTFIFCFRYIDNKKPLDLFLGCVSYFLALLAKEYAIMLVYLLPMLIYLIRYKGFEKMLVACLPYLGVLIIYLFMRGHAVGFNGHVHTGTPEILDDPYLLASHSQKLATEYFVLVKYLWLLCVPYPLISDYSYAQIPYQTFSSLPVIFSIILTYGSIILGIVLLVRKNILAFPIFFYLLNLALVSNLLLDIGATMGERLIFHSSLGFTILISYGLFKLIEKMQSMQKSYILIGLSAIVCVACGDIVLQRNKQWTNDITLFTHDVRNGPNSIMLNGNAGARYIDMSEKTKDSVRVRQLLDTAIIYLRKSIYLHKRGAYIASMLNLGDAYYQLHVPDSVRKYWNMVSQNYHDYPGMDRYDSILARMYLQQGVKYGQQKNYNGAIASIKEAIAEYPRDADLWYNLGGAYFTAHIYDSAYYTWQKTLQINPRHALAKQGLASITINKK